MLPLSLLTAVGVQVLCQLFKVVLYSVRDGRLKPRYFISAGGMPSAHSAFVTALLVAVGIRSGFASDLFAVAAVFGAIVIYDAFRLRGEVEKHAVRLNQLAEAERAAGVAAEREPLSEMVGHSIGEIVAGILVGGALSAAVTLVTA